MQYEQSAGRLVGRLAQMNAYPALSEEQARVIVESISEDYIDQLSWFTEWRLHSDYPISVAIAGVDFAVTILDLLTYPGSGVNANSHTLQKDVLKTLRAEMSLVSDIIDRMIPDLDTESV